MAWKGKDESTRKIEAIKRRMIEAAHDLVRDGSLGLQAEQQLHASGRPGPNVRTGGLRRGIRTLQITQKGPYAFQAGTKSTAIQSRILERGGTIYPKRGEYLTFKASYGWRRVRSVTIPPYPFMAPGVSSFAPKYRELARARFAAALHGG